MDRKRRPTLHFEPLEGKQLLSTVEVAAPLPNVDVSVQSAVTPAPFTIDGTLRTPVGSIKTFVSNEGSRIGTFKVSGKLKGIGQVKGAFFAELDETNQMVDAGGLTLSNRKGTVSLILRNDPLDETAYTFTIVSGTKKFQGVSGSGKIATSGASRNGRTLFFAVATNVA